MDPTGLSFNMSLDIAVIGVKLQAYRFFFFASFSTEARANRRVVWQTKRDCEFWYGGNEK
jgi:hypothetical protein